MINLVAFSAREAGVRSAETLTLTNEIKLLRRAAAPRNCVRCGQPTNVNFTNSETAEHGQCKGRPAGGACGIDERRGSGGAIAIGSSAKRPGNGDGSKPRWDRA